MISLDAASVTLNGHVILRPITLQLHQQRIGIIGRNGSGKTTLLRLIAGLIPATTGQVTIGGASPNDRKAMLTRIGILFQNPDHQILFPTAAEEIAFGLIQMGQTNAMARKAALDLLTQEGRAAWADAPTHTLSGGQRHYLCLLSILAMAPETILLDEPFAGLDLPTQMRLARRLAALPQRLITISHDPAAMRDVERVIWLDAGDVRADGTPDDILPIFLKSMKHLGDRDADADIIP
jgi:biotin transport system ATP-binding protein